MSPFLGKPLSTVALDDLKRLVDDAVGENLNLDYKRQLVLDDKEQKKEFLRDITAFANAEGGTIIYGVDEERDGEGRPTGLPKDLLGFDVPNRDAVVLTIEHLLKDGIDERLPSYEIGSVEIGTGKLVVMIRVSPSLRAPHMVTLAGERRFFIRGNSGRQEMSTAQIRDAVLRTESVIERVHAFVRERVAKWRAQGMKGPFWMMHIIPLVRNPSAIDVTDPKVTRRLIEMGSPRGGDYGHCIEGFKVWSNDKDEVSHAITFRNGTVEFLDQHPFLTDKQLFACGVFDNSVIQLLHGALGLYREARLQLPAAVCITLHGVKGYVLPGERRILRTGAKLDEDEVFVDPIVLVDIPADVKPTLRPALDFLWNAFGYLKCEGYDAQGKYIGYR